MSSFASCIYAGKVVHKRLAPRRHAFSYRVFTLCLDVDEIDEIDRRLALFSRSRRNLLAFFDADLGDAGAEPVAVKTRRLLADAGLSRFAARIEVVCYPRILGCVFNPLSVYFCRDGHGLLGVVIYEVSNTFGERKCYLLETGQGGHEPVSQTCAKELYVSPFLGADGRYSFHVVPPAARIVVGVAFREGERAILKTHFRGERVPLSNGSIARLLLSHPLMTASAIKMLN